MYTPNIRALKHISQKLIKIKLIELKIEDIIFGNSTLPTDSKGN